MGLIDGLLLLPLAPVRGTVWLAERIYEQAENELYDEATILREFAELEMDRAAGAISDTEAEEIEDVLYERLTIARELEEERSS
jgi:hypothetical protein